MYIQSANFLWAYLHDIKTYYRLLKKVLNKISKRKVEHSLRVEGDQSFNNQSTHFVFALFLRFSTLNLINDLQPRQQTSYIDSHTLGTRPGSEVDSQIYPWYRLLYYLAEFNHYRWVVRSAYNFPLFVIYYFFLRIAYAHN